MCGYIYYIFILYIYILYIVYLNIIQVMQLWLEFKYICGNYQNARQSACICEVVYISYMVIAGVLVVWILNVVAMVELVGHGFLSKKSCVRFLADLGGVRKGIWLQMFLCHNSIQTARRPIPKRKQLFIVRVL